MVYESLSEYYQTLDEQSFRKAFGTAARHVVDNTAGKLSARAFQAANIGLVTGEIAYAGKHPEVSTILPITLPAHWMAHNLAEKEYERRDNEENRGLRVGAKVIRHKTNRAISNAKLSIGGAFDRIRNGLRGPQPTLAKA